MGIVNGTTNFILTKMDEEGLPFDVVLKEAQALGFASSACTAAAASAPRSNSVGACTARTGPHEFSACPLLCCAPPGPHFGAQSL